MPKIGKQGIFKKLKYGMDINEDILNLLNKILETR